MSQVFERGASTPRMNMTPLIDVTFQLIIFFMLVNSIASNEVLTIVLSELDDPQTIQLGKVDRIIVNLGTEDFNRPIGVPGLNTPGELARLKVGMKQLKPEQLDEITRMLVQAHQHNPKVQVLLRADASLYFDSIHPVMKSITDAGIRRVNMVAYMEDDN